MQINLNPRVLYPHQIKAQAYFANKKGKAQSLAFLKSPKVFEAYGT